MIKDLEGELTWKLLDKYFYKRKYTEEEIKKYQELDSMFRKFNLKVYGEEDDIFSYQELFGYLENYGYYVVIDGDDGRCIPTIQRHGFDKEKAFVSIIDDYLFMNAIDYELQNRKELSKDFQKRFGIYGLNNYDKEFNSLEFFDNYFTLLYFSEYNLDKWDKYYDGNIPDEIIKSYEVYLNGIKWSHEQGFTWKYDRNIKQFNIKEKLKIRKLMK